MSNSKKFAQPIRPGRLDSPPANPEDGLIYYDTALGKLRVYQDGSWVDFDSENIPSPGSEMSILKVRDGEAVWEVDWVDLTKKRSDKESGIFKTIEWLDSTNTLRKKSELSGGTAPQFTTRTVTFYDTDGTTVLNTVVYSLSYDGDGDLEEEELQ
jgi:hypothetical protein